MGVNKKPQKLPVVSFCRLVYTKEVFSIVGQKTKVKAYKKKEQMTYQQISSKTFLNIL